MYKNHKSSSPVLNLLSIVMENPHEMKALLVLQCLLFLQNTNENWSCSVVSFFSDRCDKQWSNQRLLLLAPFFSHGICFTRKGKKVNWKLIPMCLINGHWRMHSNLCGVQLFHSKSHSGNYSLLPTGVNVFVAHAAPLTTVVLFSGILHRMWGKKYACAPGWFSFNHDYKMGANLSS